MRLIGMEQPTLYIAELRTELMGLGRVDNLVGLGFWPYLNQRVVESTFERSIASISKIDLVLKGVKS